MQTTTHRFNDLLYKQCLIGGATEDNNPRTVIAIHYMTGDADAMAFMFEEFDQPARLIFPQAPYPSQLPEGGYAWFPYGLGFYDDMTEAQQAPLIKDAADRIASLIQHISRDKVAVVGMSQGGDVTMQLVVHYPHLLKLTIPIAARLSADMRPVTIRGEALPSVHLMAGQIDEIVPVAGMSEVRGWLQAQGYRATLAEYAGVGHSISPEMVNDFMTVLQP